MRTTKHAVWSMKYNWMMNYILKKHSKILERFSRFNHSTMKRENFSKGEKNLSETFEEFIFYA